MKTAFEPELKSKTFCISKSAPLLVEKEVSLVNFKFYQKLFVFLISISTILIFPESPKELESICETYNSRKICNVW
ncbi:transcription factor TFIID [Prochlorococcus marinus]|uniref:Putative Transcription factor TFIID n=1 Tax=Prochlorococcus marinus str. SB TaxID=59926 RepID=A0A0A2B7G7_PROMR|nr:putative Transcription factor TFIID [Prochlorococcus marinus str. SB]